MTPCAIFFGAIGAVTSTSGIQRHAFNAAFKEHGLDWHWSPESYRDMLTKSGGKARIERYAAANGQTVDADAIHASKVEHFRRLAVERGLDLRPGVAEVVAEAREAGIPLGFVTSTGADTVDLIFEALGDKLSRDDFAFVGDRSMVERSKPAPDIYVAALDAVTCRPDMVLAIEDTPESAEAAMAAGLRVIAFPDWAAEGRPFPDGCHVVERLTGDMVRMTIDDWATAAE